MSVAITRIGWREAQASPTAPSVLAAPGPGGGERDAQPPARAGVAVGGVGGGLLVPHAHQPDRRAVQLAPQRRGCARRGARRPRSTPASSSAATAAPRPCQDAARWRAHRSTIRAASPASAWPTSRACSPAPTARWCSPTSAPTWSRSSGPRAATRRAPGARRSPAARPPTTCRSTAASAAARSTCPSPRAASSRSSCAPRADVVIENFKVGGADRLGVGYEPVRERNPRVVYCSITGFGSERDPARPPRLRLRGPGRERPDVDHRAGGRARRTRSGVALVDVLAGLHAAAGVLAALHGGEGARIEVPLLDSGLAGLVNVAQNALVTGREPERHGNAHPNIVPYQDFETSSGRIAVAAANDGLFRALCSAHRAGGARPRTSASPPTPARVEHRGGARAAAPGAASASAPRRSGCAASTPPGCPPGRCARCRTRSRRPRPRAARPRSRSSTRRPARSTSWPRRSGAPPGRRADPAAAARASTRPRCWRSWAGREDEIEALAERGGRSRWPVS